MTFQTLDPVPIPVPQLRPYDRNPKKAIGDRQRKGLNACIEEFGFAGALNVALDSADPSYVVLDGNTRLELLQAHKIPLAWCYIHPALAYDQPDHLSRRHALALSYDRNRKVYDEQKVIEDLKDLVAKGADVARLSLLTGVEKLKRITEEAPVSQEQIKQAVAAARQSMPAMESLILYGPSSTMAEIHQLLDGIRQRLAPHDKVKQLLAQAKDNIDFDSDEQFLLIFLAALAAYEKALIQESA